MDCGFCQGTRVTSNTYVSRGIFTVECPRCKGTGQEPSDAPFHPGLLLRSTGGKVWAVYSSYEGTLASPRAPGQPAWGVHRMIPDRVRGGHYVWQIRVLPEEQLRRWTFVGYGTAWDHALMEARPLDG